MKRICALILFAFAIPGAQAQDVNSVLKQAAATIGADKVKTIHYGGSGYDYALGQNANPYIPFPRFNVESYDMWVDYGTGTLKEQRVRSQYEEPIRGGSQQPLPQRTEVLLVKGNAAVALRDGGQGPVQSPADAAPQLAVGMTPHGFIQKAMQSGPTMKEIQHNGITYKAVTFVLERFPVTGYIGPDNFLRRVETRVPNPLYGDMKVAVSFHEYKDFNGIQFPSRILEKQADFPTLEIDVDMVETGVEVATELPERAAPPFPRGPELPNQKVADGVWLIQGGPHNSVAVEFDDFVTIVEAPLGEWLSMGVINTVKKLIPGKPIRYLVNTHHHFDHAAGFRTYAAEGATIVTHKQNLAFYQELLEAPRELSADRLSESGKDVNFETLTFYHEISDGDRTIALHLITGDPHSDGMIMAYLAEEKILIEADVYNPGIPMMQADAPPHPFSVNLYRIMRTLGLDVEKIIPIHGPVATIGDLRAHVNAE